MPRYRGPKDVIDGVLRRFDKDARAKLVKSYKIILPDGVAEIETTEALPELKDYEA